MGSGWEVPSLLRLCIQTAIDNVRYIGDVGETDITLLKDILPHCTLDQLAHIEKSTEGRDLSAVTDSLWKRFYEGAFGVESVNLVVKRMKENAVVFKWRLLYEAKAKEREAAQKKIAGQLKQRYAEEEKKRQSRQIQVVDKKPPSTCKRMFSGGNESCYNVSNIKGSLMKKAKLEYLNSHEAKIHATMRKNALKSKNFPPPSAVRPTNTSSILGKGSASSSKPTKPLTRRL
uniref:Elongin-A n=2 Tax=Anthurium amnicola TaxID=1678845 RepID=A0A1D1YEG3_9ARAE